MGDSEEEFEPLFDYTRVQPCKVIVLDDDLLESPPRGFKKKPKIKDSAINKNGGSNDVDVEIIDIEEDKMNKDDEDWLSTPPKITTDKAKLAEDSIIKEFRMKRLELESLALPAKDILREVEESVKQEIAASESNRRNTSSEFVATDGGKDHLARPAKEREKIVISFQNKDEIKQFRVYMDDKFEKVFLLYADRLKLDVQNLVFTFDGDKISPTATPGGLGMEENDIVEVYSKKK